MKLALDTNAYTDLAKGVPQIELLVSAAEFIYIPFVVLGELRSGFAVGLKGSDNERVLALFLAKPNVCVLYADESTISYYAAVFKQLRIAGKMIPTNDLWIAAIVIQHGLTLLTRDTHFDSLAQIQRA